MSLVNLVCFNQCHLKAIFAYPTSDENRHTKWIYPPSIHFVISRLLQSGKE